jgi:hypothetical protein
VRDPGSLAAVSLKYEGRRIGGQEIRKILFRCFIRSLQAFSQRMSPDLLLS